MTETTADIIEGQIEKFDALREEFETGGARCFLIKRAPDSQKFIAVLELEAGWYVKWNEYRQQLRISYATADQTFADFAGQTSYFAYGVPDEGGAIDVYKTDDDRRDKVQPNGANPYWKFYVLREASERFTVT
jgi:hypothetical protein